MTIQFCKSCQSNNVNTRVEWRTDRPGKEGKKQMFDIDKNVWHSPCPYWKPDPNYKPKSGYRANVPDDVKQEFAKIEQEVAKNETKDYSNADIMLAVNNLQLSVSTIEAAIRQLTKDVGEALAKMSFEKASKI
jgi:hypothetical protein